ncbi:MAG: ABC transporter substrate-binding protein [Bdellovibrionaceae bacterium]|nr:ABC transporter substrate-binding protein [Pseudobdellovibrionaceae bacterium]
MKILCKVWALILAAIILSGVPTFAEKSPVQPVVVKLALNWKPEPQFGGFYTAELLKLDVKNGVQMQIQPGGAGTPVVQMVSAGKIDFGIASADEVVLSRANGSDVVALFAVYQTNPQAIMVRADRGLKSLADVFQNEGTLAMQKGLPYAVYLQGKYGKGMKVKVVPYVGGISNFLSDPKHSQQCFVTSEPLLAKSKGVNATSFLVAESGYNPYTTVLISRSSFVKAHSQVTQAMVAAVKDGWLRYLTDEKAAGLTNARMHELNPSLDIGTFRDSAQAQKLLILPEKAADIGRMTEKRWADLQDQLFEMKILKRKVPATELFWIE